ncbi:MAG: FkbM family methyltransferase, partial [Verrucomicrobiota bacterium]
MSTQKPFDRARKAHDERRFDEAEAICLEALHQTPDDSALWNLLGSARFEQHDFDRAYRAWSKALKLRPTWTAPWTNTANCLVEMGRMEEAIRFHGQALKLKPEDPILRYNLGFCRFRAGMFEVAEKDFRQALESAPDKAEIRHSLGMLVLLSGNYEEGWRLMRSRLETNIAEWLSQMDPGKEWDGSPLGDQTLIIAHEQGLGDCVQFSRFAIAVREANPNAKVILRGPARLRQLLSTIEAVDGYASIDDEVPSYDAWVSIMDLPLVLGLNDEKDYGRFTPYLRADTERVDFWREKLSKLKGLKIGISWQGSTEYSVDRIRSFPLSAFIPLARLDGVHLIALQCGEGSEQVSGYAEQLPLVLPGKDFDTEGGAFSDTAAVAQSLDLVIASDSSLAHVMGGLGVPTWLVLGYPSDWRFLLNRDDNPWYPGTQRIFRSRHTGGWTEIFDSIADALLETYPDKVRIKPPHGHRLCGAGELGVLQKTPYGLMNIHRGDTAIGRSIATYGEWSSGEIRLFRDLVRLGDVVVEAGSNIGAHTLPLSLIVGKSGRVHAFEAQPMIYRILCANLALNSRLNVEAYNEALGEAQGIARVPIIDYTQTQNFGALELESEDTKHETIPVRKTTIDSLNLDRCKMIKADVEGMELQVLVGAAKTIERLRPFLFVENDREENS